MREDVLLHRLARLLARRSKGKHRLENDPSSRTDVMAYASDMGADFGS